ncbi:Monooxygenase FAD-binding [Penicillium sp. IBT 16267x]|nr:Monooxygenase FAD-binding [Penicillium sp. IBT 16267x]
MTRIDVLIIGAGPTGLVLALWLHKQGITVRIVDIAEGPAKRSRALVVHARILELYRQLDLVEELQASGYQLPATNIWVEGRHRAHLGLSDVGRELTPYPYILMLPQDDHERILENKLQSLGVLVERNTEFLQYVDRGSSVTATLHRKIDGSEIACEAAYIVGCDGSHSAVRHSIGAKYEGETYLPLFYIADLEAEDDDNPLFNGEGHLKIQDDTFTMLLPFSDSRHVRLVGTIIADGDQKVDMSTPHPDVKFEDVLPDIKKSSGIEIKKLNWFSTYRIHHRVAETYHKNRAFLVGDAAHIHSPVGGQGMNTGIMDAINLAWKLATVIKNPDITKESQNNLLDSYETERRAFALNVIGTTDHGFTVLTGQGFFPRLMRNWIIPYLFPFIMKFHFGRTRIFRGVSQLVCTYRGSPLSQMAVHSGTVQPGDRLPWAKIESSDNYSTINNISWQIHVYGDQRPDLAKWCSAHSVQLTVFDWDPHHGKVGFKKDAAYLLRPDQYIAGIFELASIESSLDDYFSSHGLAC